MTVQKKSFRVGSNAFNKPQVLSSGLQITDLKIGTGPEAFAGDTVEVHYRAMLENGRQFDASYDRGKSFTFPLGRGRVIKGWDEGVQGIKVGGKRKLIVPSELAYGRRGAGGVIPPNETLIFEVEVISVNGIKNTSSLNKAKDGKDTLIFDEIIGQPIADADGNGLVDGANNHQIYNNGFAIDVTDAKGWKQYDHKFYQAIKAVSSEFGYKVLLKGDDLRTGQHYVLDLNESGVITNKSGWKNTSDAIELGWESTFGDISGDGIIGVNQIV